MKALVTGASSGIGREIAIYLASLNYELILVARNEKKLEEIKKKIKNTEVKIISLDLSKESNCIKLYEKLKNDKIDVLVNNAGFGIFGEFSESNLNQELEMINLNIKAVHILTKLFLKEFKIRNSGFILNVASSAAFQPGPLMASYYSTKAYVLRLTTAIYEELKREKSKVSISVLCPGPVDTNFNKRAQVTFGIKSTNSKYVAKYTIDKMLKKKLIIIPTLTMKIGVIISKFLPIKAKLKITYNIQKQKR